MTREDEIAILEAKLRAREGRPGFKTNTEELRKKLDRLKQEAADGV